MVMRMTDRNISTWRGVTPAGIKQFLGIIKLVNKI